MLLNKSRAYEVMDKYKIDGLLAAQRQNVYYLSDFFSYTLAVERHFSTFAVLPRRENMPEGCRSGGLQRATSVKERWQRVAVASSRLGMHEP